MITMLSDSHASHRMCLCRPLGYYDFGDIFQALFSKLLTVIPARIAILFAVAMTRASCLYLAHLLCLRLTMVLFLSFVCLFVLSLHFSF